VTDANAHAQSKEEAHLEIVCSRSCTKFVAQPSSCEYALEDPPEDGAEAAHANGEAAEEAGDDDVQP